MKDSPQASEFRGQGGLLTATILGSALSLTIMPVYTIGMIAPAMAAEFGWTLAAVMAGFSCLAATIFITSPIVGALIDRFGVRAVALPSILLFGLSLALLAFGNGNRWAYYANWIAISVFGVGTTNITWARALSQKFRARLGFAIGVSMFGAGVFAIAIKPLLTPFIETHGWRAAYLVLGIAPIVLALPAAWLWLPRETAATRALDTREAAGLTFHAALRDYRLWLILLSVVPMAVSLSGVVSNLEPILRTDVGKGYSLALISPYLGVGLLTSRIVGSALLDRLWAPLVGCFLLSVSGVGAAILASGSANPVILACALFMVGVAAGIEFDLLAYLVTRFFGLRAFGKIFGLVCGIVALGSSAGPTFFALFRDIEKTYAFPLYTASLMLIASGMLLLPMGRYRFAHTPTAAHEEATVLAGEAAEASAVAPTSR